LWAGLLWGVGTGRGVVPLTLAGCVGVMGALAVAVRRLD
jgi:hypothetical protein